MLGIFVSDIYVPALPFMEQDLRTTKAELELSVALYFLSFSLSQLIYGPMADHYGRKPIIMLGLGIALIGSVLCILADSGPTLIIGRLIQGLGMGAPVPIARIILRDLFSGVQLARWSSYVGALLLLAPALALIFGGYLAYMWHWVSIFVFLIIFTLIMLLVVWHVLPETKPNIITIRMSFREMLICYKNILMHRTFCGYAAVAAIALAGMVVYLTLSSFLFQQGLGFSIIGYSWMSVFVSAALIAGMLTNAQLVGRFHPDKLIVVGLSLKCLAGALLITVLLMGWFNAVTLVITIILFAFGCSLVFANAASGAFTPFTQNIGFVGALFGASQMLIAGIAGTIAALMQSQAAWVLAITFFILGIILAAV